MFKFTHIIVVFTKLFRGLLWYAKMLSTLLENRNKTINMFFSKNVSIFWNHTTNKHFCVRVFLITERLQPYFYCHSKVLMLLPMSNKDTNVFVIATARHTYFCYWHSKASLNIKHCCCQSRYFISDSPLMIWIALSADVALSSVCYSLSPSNQSIHSWKNSRPW